MLSWRLWRTIADADINDPIFRRVSQIQKPSARTMPHWRTPRLFWLLTALATTLALILAPQMLVLVLAVPIIMITLIVAAPVYLPLVIWVVGAFSTGEIISGIYREKHQFTYDLICASTQGKLKASWSFASGILYRGGWFAPLRWGTRTTLRFGLATSGGLTLFVLLFALSNTSRIGTAQLRLVLLPLLFMAVYFMNMTQTFVVGHIIALLASSFDWVKRDAMLVGLVAYALLGLLPLVGAGLAYFAFTWLVFEPHPLTLMGVETFALLLIVFTRELTIMALWSALRRRMNSSRSKVDRREILRRDAAWGVT